MIYINNSNNFYQTEQTEHKVLYCEPDILSNTLCAIIHKRNYRTKTPIICSFLLHRRMRYWEYQIRLVEIVDNGGSGEKRNDDDDAGPGQRRSAGWQLPSPEFVIHSYTAQPGSNGDCLFCRNKSLRRGSLAKRGGVTGKGTRNDVVWLRSYGSNGKDPDPVVPFVWSGPLRKICVLFFLGLSPYVQYYNSFYLFFKVMDSDYNGGIPFPHPLSISTTLIKKKITSNTSERATLEIKTLYIDKYIYIYISKLHI